MVMSIFRNKTSHLTLSQVLKGISRALCKGTRQELCNCVKEWREEMLRDLQHFAISDERKATAVRLWCAVMVGRFRQLDIQKCGFAVSSWYRNHLDGKAAAPSTLLQAMLQADKLFRRSDTDGNLLLDCEEMHALLSSVVQSEGLDRTPIQIEVWMISVVFCDLYCQADVLSVMSEWDREHIGAITFGNFMSVLCKEPWCVLSLQIRA